jgi:hypothetical protein
LKRCVDAAAAAPPACWLHALSVSTAPPAVRHKPPCRTVPSRGMLHPPGSGLPGTAHGHISAAGGGGGSGEGGGTGDGAGGALPRALRHRGSLVTRFAEHNVPPTFWKLKISLAPVLQLYITSPGPLPLSTATHGAEPPDSSRKLPGAVRLKRCVDAAAAAPPACWLHALSVSTAPPVVRHKPPCRTVPSRGMLHPPGSGLPGTAHGHISMAGGGGSQLQDTSPQSQHMCPPGHSCGGAVLGLQHVLELPHTTHATVGWGKPAATSRPSHGVGGIGLVGGSRRRPVAGGAT